MKKVTEQFTTLKTQNLEKKIGEVQSSRIVKKIVDVLFFISVFYVINEGLKISLSIKGKLMSQYLNFCLTEMYYDVDT